MSTSTENGGGRPGGLRAWAWYPFLFAVFPVLSLLSANVENTPMGSVRTPLVVALSLTLGALAVLWPVFRDSHKSAAFLMPGLFLFYTYGLSVDLLRGVMAYQRVLGLGVAGLSAGAVLLGLAAFAVWLRRSKRSWAPLSRVLNVIGFCAVLVSLGSSASQLYAISRRAPVEHVSLNLSGEPQADLPNIVYIIVDAYGREDVLREIYDYDNTPFLDALRERNYFVTENSYSNYNYTPYSIPSAFYLRMLTGLAVDVGGEIPPETLFGENPLMEALKGMGYRTISFHSDLSSILRGKVDEYISPTREIHAFHATVANWTPLRFVRNRIAEYKEEHYSHRASFHDLHRETIKSQVAALGEFEFGDQPHFVFAHIMSPHWPFVFDADGGAVYPKFRYDLEANYLAWLGPTDAEFISGYPDQIRVLNRMLLPALDALLEKNPNTVIVLQGDHGPRRNYATRGTATWRERLREEMAILNVYYFPDPAGYAGLSHSITPIDSFRVIFNTFLGGDLAPAEEAFYFIDARPYRVFEVTEEMRALQ